jgi:hypothetical protein
MLWPIVLILWLQLIEIPTQTCLFKRKDSGSSNCKARATIHFEYGTLGAPRQSLGLWLFHSLNSTFLYVGTILSQDAPMW